MMLHDTWSFSYVIGKEKNRGFIMVSEENKDNQMNKDSKRPTIKKSENETTKPFSPKKIEEEKAIHRTNEQTIIRRRKSPDNKVKPKILSNAASEETLEIGRASCRERV